MREDFGNSGLTPRLKAGLSSCQTTFPCSACSKVFTKKSRLEQHMRAHTGEVGSTWSVWGVFFA
jgi:hypothetical protein